MKKVDIAIVVVTFNRPNSLERLLKSLYYSDYTGYSDIILYISIDFSDNSECQKIAESFDWIHGDKIIISHNSNLGLKKHILSCGDLVKKHDAIIVLEDDLLVSPQYFKFAVSAYDFYKNDSRIAGISLYNYNYNENAYCGFEPIYDGFDNYFMQVPSSWGQMWTKDNWEDFRNYTNEERFENESSLFIPDKVLTWPINKSWKRSFYKFLITKDKYFIFPRNSLTTNCGDMGANVSYDYDVFQSSLSIKNHKYYFSSFDNSYSIYDSYFEFHELAFMKFSHSYESVSFDLYGTKPIHKIKTKFLFSIKNCENSIRKFDFKILPYENNVILNVEKIKNDSICIYYAETNQFKNSVGFERINIELRRYFAHENPYIKKGKDEVYRTLTFRIGNMILSPIRVLRKLFKKV